MNIKSTAELLNKHNIFDLKVNKSIFYDLKVFLNYLMVNMGTK